MEQSKFSHSSFSATLSSHTVLGKTLQLWILSFNCFQMFSIGFRSGEFAGQSITTILFSLTNPWLFLQYRWVHYSVEKLQPSLLTHELFSEMYIDMKLGF